MAYKKFSTTKATALAAAVSASATTIEVVDGSSYPDPAIGGNGPYTLLLAYGSDREEIVTVTAKPSANTLTVVRGQDGSAATTKNIGDIVVHGVSKRDWEDVQTAVDSLSSQVGTLASEMNAKAPLASPTLTGDPKAPTPAAGDNDTSIATTAFVQQQVPIGTIVMWGGTTAPAGWHLCDGSAHGSSALQTVLGSANAPDLRNRFIVGAGAAYARGSTGGADTVTLTAAQSGVPAHTHTVSGTASGSGAHAHTQPNPEYKFTFSRGYRFANTGTDYSVGEASLLDENTPTAPAHTHPVTGSAAANTATAASAAHENRPPYYALSFIIKKA